MHFAITPAGRSGGLSAGLLVFCVGLITPSDSHLAAQQRCRYTTTGYTQSSRTDGNLVHQVSGTIDYRCPGGVRILADSAVIFERNNLAELYGNVRFQDPDTELVARRAFYYGNNRQLNAWEQIRLIDRVNGAVITGEELILYRAAPNRPLDRMIIRGGEPHATVFLTEGGIESVIPYEVDAERFTLEGRRYFRAGGGVEVFRLTLNAVGDSLDFDQDVGVMSVFEEARVTDANFDLSASTVTVLTPAGVVEEVLARENAELLGDGVVLVAPAIRMFVENNLVQRLVAIQEIPPIPTGLPALEDLAQDALGILSAAAAAQPGGAVGEERPAGTLPPEGAISPQPVPPVAEASDQSDPDAGLTELGPQPEATTAEFRIWADSIDILSPDQALDRVTAVGTARGESLTPDSVRQEAVPDIATGDWMEGDTIVIVFRSPVAPTETTGSNSGGATVESVTTMGSARSLYRLPPSDTIGGADRLPPALHYVRASVIRVHLDGGVVTRMEVEGRTSGFHFEPTVTVPGDTVASPPPPTVNQASESPPLDETLRWWSPDGPVALGPTRKKRLLDLPVRPELSH